MTVRWTVRADGDQGAAGAATASLMVHQKKAAEGLLFSSKPAKTAWYVISALCAL
ncbi:MAG: hypothetical protein IJU41_02825 [Clostridia bacterium]|nr:hypothetical protein [Clostridia bacterium]